MGGITNRVTGEMLHHVRSRWSGINSVEREYRRQPFRAVRPGRGQPPAPGEIVCETCGETISYRISSAHSTVRRRRIWLAVALSGITLSVVSTVLLFQRIDGFDGWPVLGGSLGFGIFVAGLVVRVSDDGVRVGRRRPGTRPHVMRTGTLSTEGYEGM
ncbi:hypothetical protein [Catenuloplanes japonicus]|uniref:hypothetical protein n=1 Tax=Catenuloplanes japonicus TaxID=33876 RepID=UPI0005273AA3|nr:hypothetical protein [Catenuloplanes japonicus]